MTTVDDGDRIIARFAGPIRESDSDVILTLTHQRALAFILAYRDPASGRQLELEMEIPRHALRFAQRADWPQSHLFGPGGEGYGRYVDGFEYPFVIQTLLLSAAQLQALKQFDEAWGGRIAVLSQQEALERLPHPFRRRGRKLG